MGLGPLFHHTYPEFPWLETGGKSWDVDTLIDRDEPFVADL